MSGAAVHLLIVGLITLLVTILCGALWWHLWRGNRRTAQPNAPITPDMVKQKLAQIDLDLSAPSGDDKPA